MTFDPDKFLSDEPQAAPGFDPDAFLSDKLSPIEPKKEQKGLIDRAIDGVVKFGKKVDSYTGAPVRSAINATIDGENPLLAYGHQFGANPDNAPTGKLISEKLGVSDEPFLNSMDPKEREAQKQEFLDSSGYPDWIAKPFTKFADNLSPSDVTGFGIDIAADPLNFFGVGEAEKALKFAGEAAGKTVKTGAKGLDLLTGSKKATGAVDAVANAAETASNSLASIKDAIKSTKPKVADDFAIFRDIAEKNNLDVNNLPASIEFGPNSFITRAERVKAEGPLGAQYLDRHNNSLEQLQNSFDSKIADSVAKHGVDADPVEAGKALRSMYDESADNFFKNIDMTYKSVAQQVPEMTLTPAAKGKLTKTLNQVEELASRKATNGITNTDRGQGEQLLRAIGIIKNSGGDFATLTDSLQEIGKAAFKSKNTMADIPIDAKEMRKIYHTLSESLIDTTRARLGDQIADELIANNKKLSDFFGDKSKFAGIMGDKATPPERVFKRLIMDGDSQQLEGLANILGPEKMQSLKGAFLGSLAKRDIDGAISFRNLRTMLANKRQQMGAIFSADEIQELEDIAKLGDRIGNPIMSSSGTGASNQFSNLIKSVGDSFVNDQVIDSMKRSARNLPEPPPQIPLRSSGPIPSGAASSAAGFSPALSLPVLNSKMQAAAKGASVLGTQENNKVPETLIDKIDANPDLLETIKNPTLRAGLVHQINKRRAERQEQLIGTSLNVKPSETKLQNFEPNRKVNEIEAQKSFIEGN